MSANERIWLAILLVTMSLLSIVGFFTLDLLRDGWAEVDRIPFAVVRVETRTGLNLPWLHLLSLMLAFAVAWVVAKFAPTILAKPGHLAVIGGALLAAPLIAGSQVDGAWRFLSVGESFLWYPGPWALLAIVPVQVRLVRDWHRSGSRRYIAMHFGVTTLGLFFFAMQPDEAMFWALTLAAFATLLPARSIKAMGVSALLVIATAVVWFLVDPRVTGIAVGRGGYFHDAVSCGFFPQSFSPLEWLWSQAAWTGSSQDLRLRSFYLPEAEKRFILAAIAQLFGRAAALAVIAFLLLFTLALLRLVSARSGNTGIEQARITIRVYALIVLGMVVMTAASSMGINIPGLALPFLSYGTSDALLFACIAGSAIGVASATETVGATR